LIAVAEAEFRYSDLLPTGADDTPSPLAFESSSTVRERSLLILSRFPSFLGIVHLPFATGPTKRSAGNDVDPNSYPAYGRGLANTVPPA
jgi:hypothetical protein